MSPALTDTGDLHLRKGQLFSAQSSYNNLSEHKTASMDHNLRFTSSDSNPSPFGSSASSRLQKPRLCKKKYTGAHRKDQMFIPFRGFGEIQEMNMDHVESVSGGFGNVGFASGVDRGSGDVGNEGFVFGTSRSSGDVGNEAFVFGTSRRSGDVGNEGFVFGTSRSSGDVGNEGFVFGTSRSSGDVGNEAFVFGTSRRSGDVGNEGFVFGTSRSSGDVGNEGFVFGTSRSSGDVGNEGFVFGTSRSSGDVGNEGFVFGTSGSSGDFGNEGFVFGASRSSGLFGANLSNSHGNIGEGTIPIDEMRKLNIESEKKMNVGCGVNNVGSTAGKGGSFVFTGGDAKLDEMVSKELEKKLNIKSEGAADSSRNMDSVKSKYNVFCSFSSSENVDSKIGGGVGVELLNEMDKLNIKGRTENDMSDYAYKEKGSLSGKSETLIQDKMKNMHISKPMGYVANENVKVDPSSSDPSGNAVNKSASGISDSIPSGFSFQAGTQNNHFTNQVHPNPHSGTIPTSSFPSFIIPGESMMGTFEAPSTDRTGKKVEFSFSTKSDGMLNQNLTPTIKGSLNKKVETRREATRNPRYKKKKMKPKQTLSTPMNLAQDFAFRGSSEENAEPSKPYSPMDISPYRETPENNTLSRGTSVASDESFILNENYGSSDSHPAVPNDITDEDLIDATVRMNINENDVSCSETQEVESRHSSHHGVDMGGPEEESTSISGAETESFKSATEHLDYSTDSFITAADTEVTSKSTIERQDSDGESQFNVVSNLEEACQGSFIFSASSVAQNQIAAATRQQKKKNRTKLINDSSSSTTKLSYSSSPGQFFQVSGSSPLSSPTQGKKGNIPTMINHSQGNNEQARVKEVNHETVAASMAAQEACEKWRLRGNQAYADGNLSKAEECYTQGLNCVSESDSSKSCLRALMLCYSNRAATRMSLGRMREALEDCMKAFALDPNFFRVQVRAANCYLALGEVENASKFFMTCLQHGPEVCVDRKILVEASEGLQKAQRVSECMKQCVELLQRRRQSDAELVLGVVCEALTISTYSEKLLELKADALLMLRRYEEVIQLCEKTLEFAKSNAPPYNFCYQSPELDSAITERSASSRLWCFSKIVKSYFYLGKLEEADSFLKNQEKSMCLMESSGLNNLEAVVPLAVTIRELLCFKAAGNAAFQSGKHAEAVEHYTAAVSCNFESRPFTAICFCNRAAAYRAMGQISDAIADCSLAIALDGNYAKALSRRASLFEMIRDYGQAASDLQRLVSLLTRHMENKVSGSGSHNKMSSINEIRQTQQKLSAMEEEARKEIPLNFYLILGVDPSVGASEIRKAYRKAALKHHPDKAGQSLARNDNADDGLWKEIAEEVHKDADRLFKMIGEAYAVLSDSAKRSRYDLEEEMRNSQSRGNESSTFREHTEFNNYPYERSGGRRHWEDVWRAYKSTQSRESDRNRANL